METKKWHISVRKFFHAYAKKQMIHTMPEESPGLNPPLEALHRTPRSEH